MTETDVTFQPPDSFRCETGRDGGIWWVRPAPPLDQPRPAARAPGEDRMVLDMRALTFMDSTGLRLVIRWDTSAKDEGFEFAIVPGPEVVQRVFRLTGMEEHLPVADPPAES